MKSYVTFAYKILKILKLKTKLEYISKLLLFKLRSCTLPKGEKKIELTILMSLTEYDMYMLLHVTCMQSLKQKANVCFNYYLILIKM